MFTAKYLVTEIEKRQEAELRAKEARERDLRKREKMEEKERRRKEYDAQKIQQLNEPKEKHYDGVLESKWKEHELYYPCTAVKVV